MKEESKKDIIARRGISEEKNVVSALTALIREAGVGAACGLSNSEIFIKGADGEIWEISMSAKRVDL